MGMMYYVLECIDLERNSIQTNGGTEISDYISNNPPLKNLFLSANKLNDNDAILIAKALKKNTNLEHLYLFDNDITGIGNEALSNAIYDTTSLNSLAVCNHTCKIYGVGGDPPLDYLNIRAGARERKIYHLLSLRNREGINVRHLNTEFDEDEDSLKLAPKVLENISQLVRPNGVRFVHPLSIMYEVIRSWKMPELFEVASCHKYA